MKGILDKSSRLSSTRAGSALIHYVSIGSNQYCILNWILIYDGWLKRGEQQSSILFIFISHMYENHVYEGKLWSCFEGSSCYWCCLEREILQLLVLTKIWGVYTHDMVCTHPPALKKMGKGMSPSVSVQTPWIIGNEYHCFLDILSTPFCLHATKIKKGGEKRRTNLICLSYHTAK